MAHKLFKFIGDCARLIRNDEANYQKIQSMVLESERTSYRMMKATCRLPKNHRQEVSCDQSTGYFSSRFDGFKCLFYQYAGFEFIWVEEDYPLPAISFKE